jgi:hypothetical protein
MNGDISLGDVEAALKGTKFSVPREKLRLFGHVVLEVDAPKAASEKLVSDLDAIKHVSIEKSNTKGGLLEVIVDMPYPVGEGRVEFELIGTDSFRRGDFSSDQATRSEPDAKPLDLPTISALRDAVAKQGGSLKSVRWNHNYACRMLGAVAAAQAEKIATKPAKD